MKISYTIGMKTVNPFVAGSSPARGAIYLKAYIDCRSFLCLIEKYWVHTGYTVGSDAQWLTLVLANTLVYLFVQAATAVKYVIR